jgi:hypothetical protein
LLPVDESGVGEDPKVMAHRWLRYADGGGEVTHAGFRGAREKAHDLETDGIGKDAERVRHAVGLIGGERRRPQRGATRVQLGDLLPHERHIDDGRCICQRIDADRYVRRSFLEGW